MKNFIFFYFLKILPEIPYILLYILIFNFIKPLIFIQMIIQLNISALYIMLLHDIAIANKALTILRYALRIQKSMVTAAGRIANEE